MNTGKMIRRAAAVCVASALLAGSALADAVTVTAERLNVRTEANSSSRAVTVVRRGEALRFVSESGGWIQVVAGGKTGYVMNQYVTVDEKEIAADVQASTTAYAAARSGRALARVNMRGLPSMNAAIVKVIGRNDSVTLTGECGDWYAASFAGKTGYIMKEYVAAAEESAAALPQENAQASEAQQETALREYAEALTGAANVRVNVRAEASTGAKVVKVAAKGAPVSVTGEMGGWYRVYVSGTTGYIMKQYVTLAAQTPSNDGAASADADYAAPVAGRALARVNIRAAASTTAAVVTVIDRGASVSLTGETGGWYKATAGGRSGYVSKQYVSPEAGQAPQPQTTPEPTPTPGPTAYPAVETAYAASVGGTATARVNMRADASAKSAILKVIGLNDTVSVAGEKGDWYKVTYDGRTGYVMKDYLTLSAPVENAGFESWTGVTVVEVNMRKAPEGDVMYVLKAGTEVTVAGQNGSWYLISYRGSVGYVASSYVSEKSAYTTPAPVETPAPTPAPAPANGTKGYVTGGTVNIRAGAGASYGVVSVVRTGDELTLYEQVGDWYRIETGSLAGYISAKYVTTVKPEATATVAPDAGSGRVIADDWWTGSIATIFKRGETGTITDVDSGLSFQFRRTGGINHMDAQPLTSADTAIMYRIYGNQWQWTRRAIWVTYRGVRYAASMNGMPHGESDSMPDNDFDGCFCIHFLNSRTHEGNRLDAAHQAAVQKALRVGNR